MMLIIFFFDKDGCQSTNRLILLAQGVFPVVLTLKKPLVLFFICFPH